MSVGGSQGYARWAGPVVVVIVEVMDDTSTNINTDCPSRGRRFVLRWAACAVLVAGVITATRLTTHAGDSTEQGHATSPATPSAQDASITPPADPQDQPGPGFGTGDLLAAFDGVVEDLFGRSTLDPSATVTADPNADPAGWVTTAGFGAAGGRWTIDHPADWEPDEVRPGVVLFSAPNYSDVVGVITRPYTRPLSQEADRDLDQIMQGMPDATLVAVDDVNFASREAIRAELRYTNPDGHPAAVKVIWIRDDDTLYVIAGEAGLDQSDLQATVDRSLNSFTIFEVA